MENNCFFNKVYIDMIKSIDIYMYILYMYLLMYFYLFLFFRFFYDDRYVEG